MKHGRAVSAPSKTTSAQISASLARPRNQKERQTKALTMKRSQHSLRKSRTIQSQQRERDANWKATCLESKVASVEWHRIVDDEGVSRVPDALLMFSRYL